MLFAAGAMICSRLCSLELITITFYILTSFQRRRLASLEPESSISFWAHCPLLPRIRHRPDFWDGGNHQLCRHEKRGD